LSQFNKRQFHWEVQYAQLQWSLHVKKVCRKLIHEAWWQISTISLDDQEIRFRIRHDGEKIDSKSN